MYSKDLETMIRRGVVNTRDRDMRTVLESDRIGRRPAREDEGWLTETRPPDLYSCQTYLAQSR
jgi:hypothetical protein